MRFVTGSTEKGRNRVRKVFGDNRIQVYCTYTVDFAINSRTLYRLS